jgi:hypothetical protein
MHYNMTTPCDQCPFTMTPKQFSMKQLLAHASGEFACHKACNLEETDDRGSIFVPKGDMTPHCAGALIFLEKRDAPHQMMRIVERLGMYDRTKLNMEAKVR